MMMRTTEKLPDRPSMIPLTSPSTLGRRSPKRERTFAKVKRELLICIGLLDKNRHKRPTLEEVLNHPWFADFKDIHDLRVSTSNVSNQGVE